MEFRQIEYYLRVYETGSITAAAESLYITQPALSRSLRKLEEELGIVLFDTNGRKMSFTEAGNLLYQQGKKMVEIYEDTLGRINQLKGRGAGVVRIVTSYQRGLLLWLYDMIEKYEQQHEQIKFELIEKEPDAVRKSVLAGEADVGLTVHFGQEEMAGLFCRTLMDCPLWLLAKTEHPLMKKENLSYQDFRDVNVFTNYEDLSRKFAENCRACGFEPKIRFVTRQFDTLISMILNDKGIALVGMTPEPMMHYMTEYGFPQMTSKKILGRRKIENEKFGYSLVMCLRRESRQNSALEGFLDFLDENLPPNQLDFG